MKHLKIKRDLRQLLPGKRQAADVAGGLVVVALCVGGLLRIRQIAHQAHQLVTDGQRVFSPGQLVGDQAWFALRLTFAALVLVVVVGVLTRKRATIVPLTVVLMVVSLAAAITVFFTYQEYHGFLTIN